MNTATPVVPGSTSSRLLFTPAPLRPGFISSRLLFVPAPLRPGFISSRLLFTPAAGLVRHRKTVAQFGDALHGTAVDRGGRI